MQLPAAAANTTPMPTILIVDDDVQLLSVVASHLAEEGMEVYTASDTTKARRILSNRLPDLVILDVVLPNEDGLTFCRYVRQRWALPVIMLSVVNKEATRISALDTGADDYVPKPFSPAELVARIRAVLRRAQGAVRPLVPQASTIQGIVVDWAQSSARLTDGSILSLSRSELVILQHLVERANIDVSREDLLKALRHRDSRPFERTVDNVISRLRHKIETDPARPNIIKTVWGSGYRLIP